MSYRGGDTGQYGLMPYWQLERKFEYTNIWEDPNQVHDFMRDTVTDFRPDPPSLASDMPRYDNHSVERLSTRHTGSRSGLDPYTPDLFLGLTEKDPRGSSGELNFNATMNPQKYARAKFINFYPDSDNSIPESVATGPEINYKIRAAYTNFGQRFKGFSTSRGNYPAARNFLGSSTSRKNQVTNPEDCMIGDICEQQVYGIKVPTYEHKSLLDPMEQTVLNINNRQMSSYLLHDENSPSEDIEGFDSPTNNLVDFDTEDATFYISNNKPIGSRITTDHEFKVSNYGLVRYKQVSDNPYINRTDTQGDSSEPVVFRDQKVSRGLAQTMLNIVNDRFTKQSYFGQTIDFNDSWLSRRHAGLINTRRGGKAENFGSPTQNMQRLLNSVGNRTIRQNNKGDERFAGGRNTNYSQNIAERMLTAVNKHFRINTDNRAMANDTEESGTHLYLDLEGMNQSLLLTTSPFKRKTKETRSYTESLDNPMYKANKNMYIAGTKPESLQGTNNDFGSSADTPHRKLASIDSNGKIFNINDTQDDMDFRESPTFSKLSGGGKFGKYTMPYLDPGDHELNPVNDMAID